MRVTFFCFAKRKSPKKRRPPVCDPFAVRRGKPAACRLRGAPWNSLCAARAARTATASQFTKHGRFDAPAHPATAPPQAQPAGGLGAEQPNSHSGLRYARPDQRAALAPEAQGRAKQWPEWMSAPHPLCMRRGAQRAGWRVCRRTHALRELTRRSCPSGARERAASSAAHPAREHHRLPRSEAQGTQTVGSPFLCLLSFGEAKESESPAGAITRLPPHAKA